VWGEDRIRARERERKVEGGELGGVQMEKGGTHHDKKKVAKKQGTLARGGGFAKNRKWGVKTKKKKKKKKHKQTERGKKKTKERRERLGFRFVSKKMTPYNTSGAGKTSQDKKKA